MCSQRDCFFWIAVVCNYSLGGSVAVSLRCWQRMPFAFEVLHLASGKKSPQLDKKENFLFGSQPQAVFKWVLLKYTLHIQNSIRKKKRESSLLISWMQLHHSVKRVCCTFPPAFWNSKSESSKSISVCIINATTVKEIVKSMPCIQIFTWLHGQQKHIGHIISSLNMFEWELITCF